MSKKRLRRPIRKFLLRLKVLTYRTAIATGVSICAVNTLLPVQAEVDQKQVVKNMTALQHIRLTDTEELKKTIVTTYNNAEKKDENVQETKVYVSAPIVVTNPTIENLNIEVVPSTVENKVEIDQPENTAEPETSPEPSASAESAPTPEASAAPSPSVETEKTGEEKTDKKAQGDDVQADAQFNGTPLTSLFTKSNGDSLENNANGDSIDLDTVEKNQNETGSGKLKLTLTASSAQITDGSDFDPNSYIKDMKGSTDVLPVLKIDSNVDSKKSGSYTVKYTLVDVDGSTVEKTLDVTVATPAELEARKQQKAEEALGKFVKEHDGKAYDVDGYYGDQCWDLFGRYCWEMGIFNKFDCGTSPYKYVYGIPKKYSTSGADKYFDAVKPEDVQSGDWLFWDRGSSCELSHVALLVEKYDDGTGLCLSQTKGEGTRLVRLQLDLMDTNFRPKGDIAWGVQ